MGRVMEVGLWGGVMEVGLWVVEARVLQVCRGSCVIVFLPLYSHHPLPSSPPSLAAPLQLCHSRGHPRYAVWPCPRCQRELHQ